MAKTKQTFGTAQAAREHLVQLGFAPFKKGLVRGEFTATGRKAQLSIGVLGKVGQSSTGAGWGYIVTVEAAAQ